MLSSGPSTIRSTSVAARALPWLGFVGDLLQQGLTALPHDLVIAQLLQTFDSNGAGYTWASADGSGGNIIFPADVVEPLRKELLPGGEADLTLRHPLRVWHLTTGDPRPSTIARVPTRVVPADERRPLIRAFRSIGCEQQLTINVRLVEALYSTFIVTRSDIDFTDDELALARQIQLVLIGLDRQTALVRQLTPTSSDEGIDAGLTVRELTVLALLAEGHSTQAIARRLACSPRTVYKHLEHIYRKLGVRDRVNAIRVAQHWQLRPVPSTSVD